MDHYPNQETRPRGPIRPPLAGAEKPPATSEPKKPDSRASVAYRDPESREQVLVVHPEIMGSPANSRQTLKPHDRVEVQIGQQKIPLSFADYLGMLGVNYHEYETARHSNPNTNQALFRQMHQNALDQRLRMATAYDQGQSFYNYERQQGVRKEMEGFLVKVVNGSGYGEAIEGQPQNDHADQIDFFVRINPQQFRLGGEPVYFGIQHTTLDARRISALGKKARHIAEHNQKFIPEHPEFGRVTRVFYQEDNSQYYPVYGDNRSYDYTLNVLKRKQGSQSPVHEAFMHTTDGKRNDKTEAEAKLEVVRRTYNLYRSILTTLDEYIAEGNAFFNKGYEKKKIVLQTVMATMEKENPGLK